MSKRRRRKYLGPRIKIGEHFIAHPVAMLKSAAPPCRTYTTANNASATSSREGALVSKRLIARSAVSAFLRPHPRPQTRCSTRQPPRGPQDEH
jgi:hypothetical protein